MPTFQYVARDRAGKKITGSRGRDGRTRDSRAASAQGPVRHDYRGAEAVANAAEQPLRRKKKVKLNDMVVMSRQLATLVRAGLPLVEFGSGSRRADRERIAQTDAR